MIMVPIPLEPSFDENRFDVRDPEKRPEDTSFSSYINQTPQSTLSLFFKAGCLIQGHTWAHFIRKYLRFLREVKARNIAPSIAPPSATILYAIHFTLFSVFILVILEF